MAFIRRALWVSATLFVCSVYGAVCSVYGADSADVIVLMDGSAKGSASFSQVVQKVGIWKNNIPLTNTKMILQQSISNPGYRVAFFQYGASSGLAAPSAWDCGHPPAPAVTLETRPDDCAERSPPHARRSLRCRSPKPHE